MLLGNIFQIIAALESTGNSCPSQFYEKCGKWILTSEQVSSNECLIFQSELIWNPECTDALLQARSTHDLVEMVIQTAHVFQCTKIHNACKGIMGVVVQGVENIIGYLPFHTPETHHASSKTRVPLRGLISHQSLYSGCCCMPLSAIILQIRLEMAA